MARIASEKHTLEGWIRGMRYEVTFFPLDLTKRVDR